jgi:hypothetical protein
VATADAAAELAAEAEEAGEREAARSAFLRGAAARSPRALRIHGVHAVPSLAESEALLGKSEIAAV